MKGILLLISVLASCFTLADAQSSKIVYPRNAQVDSILVLSPKNKVIEKTIFQYDSLNRERLKVDYTLDDDGKTFTATRTYETYYSPFGDAVITIQPTFVGDSLEKRETIQAGPFKTILIVSFSPMDVKNFIAKTKSETFYRDSDTLASRCINYSWLNNTWERQSIVEYSYLNKNLLTEIESSIVDGAWVMTAKRDYEYDTNFNEIKSLEYGFDYQQKILIPSTKWELGYDDKERIVFYAGWSWEDTSKKWSSLMHVVTDYLANNEEFHTHFDYLNDELKKDFSTKYKYDTNENILWTEEYGNDDKGNWVMRTKSVYYYRK